MRIQMDGEPAAPKAAAKAMAAVPTARTYTVKAGDTLSAIALAQLGSASAYMEIFELNEHLLASPDSIEVGQVLKLP